jgi:hypothetical protein
MEIERLGSEELVAALRAGCGYLELNRGILDNLNVYPVPDGDTGVNMFSTFQPALAELAKSRCASLEEVSRVMSRALLRSSRGNSGFILAQFFRGFCDRAGAGRYLDAEALRKGFEQGSFAAVSSLLCPVEGTMPTVIAAMADALQALDSGSIVRHFRAAVEAGSRSLQQTPDLLPILAEAGVVDAGALGFLFIVKGMLCALQGEQVQAEKEEDYRREPVACGTPSRGPRAAYRYCLELEMQIEGAPTDAFRDLLRSLGDSVAVIGDGCRLRVHIHTNQPAALVEQAGAHGRVLQSRRDDMEEQIIRAGSAAQGAPYGARRNGVPVLSIIPGPGFRALFQELGAAACMEYEEQLPSADEILEAIRSIGGGELIFLPNDPNILPAARLAAERAEKRVYILRTESVVDGLTAMYGYSESEPAQANVEAMKDCIGLARTLRVFRSVRDARFGGLRIRKGHCFAVEGEELVTAERLLEDCVVEAVRRAGAAGRCHVSFFCGEGFDASLLQPIRKRLAESNPTWEFEQHHGGQRRCMLIISIE